MKATQTLHDLGQSLWLDNITRDLLNSGTLKRYIGKLPEGTLKALADHGEIGPAMAADGGDCEKIIEQFAKAGINVDALAAQLQDEGAKSFVKSWDELLAVIASKCAALKQAA